MRLVFRSSLKSDCALNLTAAQAASANGFALDFAVHNYMNLLGVRSPDTASLAIGMADIVAMHDSLSADFTEFSH